MPFPFSFSETVASGGTDLVSVPFPFLSRSHVHAEVDEVLVLDEELTWITDGQVQLPSTPAADAAVRVWRATPAEEPAVVFSAGALNSSNLNTASLQLLYIIQEAFDEALTATNATSNILDYLNQVADFFNQVQALHGEVTTMHGEVQATFGLLGGGGEGLGRAAPWYDFNVSGLSPPGDNEYLWLDKLPQTMLLDEGGQRWGGATNNPTSSGPATFGFFLLTGTAYGIPEHLMTWTFPEGDKDATVEAGADATTFPMVLAAGSAVAIASIDGNAGLERFGLHGALRADDCTTQLTLAFEPDGDPGEYSVYMNGSVQNVTGTFEATFSGCYPASFIASVPGTVTVSEAGEDGALLGTKITFGGEPAVWDPESGESGELDTGESGTGQMLRFDAANSMEGNFSGAVACEIGIGGFGLFVGSNEGIFETLLVDGPAADIFSDFVTLCGGIGTQPVTGTCTNVDDPAETGSLLVKIYAKVHPLQQAWVLVTTWTFNADDTGVIDGSIGIPGVNPFSGWEAGGPL